MSNLDRDSNDIYSRVCYECVVLIGLRLSKVSNK